MFGLPCLFGFQGAGPGFSGQKRKGPGVARPLCRLLVNRGSSSYSHRGDSGPGDARLGSYPRTDVLAGYIGAGRRPQPSFRLRVPNPSLFCLWNSWLCEDKSVPDSLSSRQFDSWPHWRLGGRSGKLEPACEASFQWTLPGGSPYRPRWGVS